MTRTQGASVTRLQTIPERMAEMRCIGCGHHWQDLEAACNQYPVNCPNCIVGRTEPTHDPVSGAMPEGWMW